MNPMPDETAPARPDAAEAAKLVTEAAAVPSPEVQEAIALAVCADTLGALPHLTRKRVLTHLADMFTGPTSLSVLLSIVEESINLRRDLEHARALIPTQTERRR